MAKNQVKYGLEYFQGVFDTFAELNTPEYNIFYDFFIDELSIINIDLKTSICKQLLASKKYEFDLKEIDKKDFKKIIRQWFFIEELGKIYHTEGYQEKSSDMYVNLLIENLEIINFKHFSFFSENDEQVSHEFGLVTDFVVLESKNKTFLCQFVMDG